VLAERSNSTALLIAPAEHEQAGADALRLAAALHFRCDDALATIVGDQLRHQAAGLQGHVGLAQRGIDQARLGVSLGIDTTGKGIARAAAHALAARMKINRSRHVEGLQAAATQALEQIGEQRHVQDRGKRVGLSARRLGRIIAGAPVHAEQALGPIVVRLQVGIADRPGGRCTFFVLHDLEVPLPEAEHGSAIELGVAADVVELPRAECTPGAVVPDVSRAIPKIAEHCFRVPVLCFARQALAALQDEDARAGGGQGQCDAAAHDSGADDHHVVVH
jgi:hypothetical protein